MVRVLLIESTRLVVLVALLWGLQQQNAEAPQSSADSDELVQTQKAFQESLSDVSQLFEAALERSSQSVADARSLNSIFVDELRCERNRDQQEVESRIDKIKGFVADHMEVERRRHHQVSRATQKNERSLERLSQRLDRDSGRMKQMMIRPTAQLRGNGTVGSGVLVYSQPHGIGDGKDAVYTTFVLTAHHVIEEVSGGGAEPRVIDEVHLVTASDTKPEVFRAEVVLSDRARDLALLRLNTSRQFEHLVQLMVRDQLDDVDIFTPAYAVGCPLGNRPIPTLGEVSSRSKTVDDQTFWMLSAPTFFGNSGGGVYLAQSYELIGISSMIYTYGKKAPAVVPHMGLFVPLRVIYDWLDDEGYGFVMQRQTIPSSLVDELVYRPARRPLDVEEGPLLGISPPDDFEE